MSFESEVQVHTPVSEVQSPGYSVGMFCNHGYFRGWHCTARIKSRSHRVGGVISANKAPKRTIAARVACWTPGDIYTFLWRPKPTVCHRKSDQIRCFIPTTMFVDSDPVVSVPEPNHSIHRAETREKQNIQPKQSLIKKKHSAGGWMRLVLVGSGWFWLDVVGCGWFWLDVVGSGWFWLVVVGSSWMWLVLVGSGWMWLVVVGSGWFWLVVVGSSWMGLGLVDCGFCGWFWLVVVLQNGTELTCILEPGSIKVSASWMFCTFRK